MIHEKAMALLSSVDSCNENDKEAISFVYFSLSSTLNTFNSMCINPTTSEMVPRYNWPSDKHIEKQWRFYSVKQKRKATNDIKYAKPSLEETETILKESKWYWESIENRETRKMTEKSAPTTASQLTSVVETKLG